MKLKKYFWISFYGLYKLNINLPVGTYTIEASFNGNELFNPSSIKNTITIEEPAPEPEPTPEPKSYAEKLLEYFESKFGPMSCIDDCLEAVQGRGYAYYYDENQISLYRCKPDGNDLKIY